MATERRIAALLALAIALGGCTSFNRCRSQTLLVSVALDAAAARADTLQVDITIDGAGGTAKSTPLAHAPGGTHGTIEVRFPSGYPAGKSITIVITALAAGQAIGSATTSVTLSNGCATAALTIAGTPTADLSQSPGDLAGVDQAGVDLAGVDLAGLDQAGADLLTPADLRQPNNDLIGCIPTAEDCFNGVDDDCDNLIDCDDPDCTGGGSPKANCIPDPMPFAPGLLVGGTSACSAAFPSPSPISAGINTICGVGSCGGCSSLASASCQVQVINHGSSSDCSTTTAISAVITVPGAKAGCTGFFNNSGTNYYDVDYGTQPPAWHGLCDTSSVSGTPTKQTTWTTSDTFCGGGLVGGGCLPGHICVPAAPSHCAIKAGSQLACPFGYTVNTNRFYTGFTPGSCFCDCAITASGNCTGTPSVAVWMDSNCSNVGLGLSNTCTSADRSTYSYASMTGVSVVNTLAGCGPSAAKATDATPTGEQTVCCTP